MRWDPKKVKTRNLGRYLTKEERIEIEKTIGLLKQADHDISLANEKASMIYAVAYTREGAIKYYNSAKVLLKKAIKEEETIANAAKTFVKYNKKVGTNFVNKFVTAEETILSKTKNIERITKEIIRMINFILTRIDVDENVGRGKKYFKMLHKTTSVVPVTKFEREQHAKHRIEIFNTGRKIRVELATLIHGLEQMDLIDRYVSRTLSEAKDANRPITF